jgi:hypothetical protein
MKRAVVAMSCVLLVATGCSEPRAEDSAAGPASIDTGGNERGSRKRDDKGHPKASRSHGKARGGAGRRDLRDESSRTKESRNRTRSGHRSLPVAASQGGSRISYPDAGRYRFAQQGYEQFCRGAACDRSALPHIQSVTVSFDERSRSHAVARIRAEVSKRTTNETTSTFERSGVYITKLSTSFAGQGVSYTSDVRPRPPIEALRFPLRVGQRWSGSWQGEVSGRYEVSVARRETVVVGSRSIEAFKLNTRSRFTGEVEGRSTGSVWIDPHTLGIVRSKDFLHAENALGSYETRFEIKVRSGPGYRGP